MIPAEHSPAPTRTCHACHRHLHPTATAQVCDHCHQHTARRLADLPGLYVTLAAAVAPGRRTAIHGSRHSGASAAAPVDLHILDLQADVHGLITTWVRDWHEQGAGQLPDWPAGRPGQVAAACRWLRWQWGWAAHQHPAVAEFVAEIRRAHGQVHAAATGDRGERRIGVACGCGTVLRVTVSTGSATCSGCGTWYDRIALTALPVAGRATAA